MGKKGRLPEDQRNRICLDCAKMRHDIYEYERGRCEEDGHIIDYVNNHCWCRNFKFPDWRKARIENRDGYDSTTEVPVFDPTGGFI